MGGSHPLDEPAPYIQFADQLSLSTAWLLQCSMALRIGQLCKLLGSCIC